MITQAQFDAYEAQAVTAYAARNGAESVTFSDQSVRFSTWNEVWSWLRYLQTKISDGHAGGVTGGSRTRYASVTKGTTGGTPWPRDRGGWS